LGDTPKPPAGCSPLHPNLWGRGVIRGHPQAPAGRAHAPPLLASGHGIGGHPNPRQSVPHAPPLSICGDDTWGHPQTPGRGGPLHTFLPVASYPLCRPLGTESANMALRYLRLLWAQYFRLFWAEGFGTDPTAGPAWRHCWYSGRATVAQRGPCRLPTWQLATCAAWAGHLAQGHTDTSTIKYGTMAHSLCEPVWGL
jgi:hypothetical protein